MHTSDYLRILVEEIHSAVIATIGPVNAVTKGRRTS